MLDLDTIRTRTDEVRQNCANRRIDADVDAVLRLADERSDLIQETERMRARRNELSGQIPQASDTDRPALVEEAQRLKADVAEKEQGLAEGISTRLLIYAGQLIRKGIDPHIACTVSICQPLTDDLTIQQAISELVKEMF